jgi:hypothetical protein
VPPLVTKQTKKNTRRWVQVTRADAAALCLVVTSGADLHRLGTHTAAKAAGSRGLKPHTDGIRPTPIVPGGAQRPDQARIGDALVCCVRAVVQAVPALHPDRHSATCGSSARRTWLDDGSWGGLCCSVFWPISPVLARRMDRQL